MSPAEIDSASDLSIIMQFMPGLTKTEILALTKEERAEMAAECRASMKAEEKKS